MNAEEWEEAVDEEGQTYWINHTSHTTSWRDPKDPTSCDASASPKYLPYEWWKPKQSDQEGLRNRDKQDSHGKTVGAFAKLQARLRAKRSRELHGKRLEEGKAWAPFVTTKMAVVRKMLQITQAGVDDIVVDLGSGEGRICIVAALECGARAIGIEIDPVRCCLTLHVIL